MAEQYSQGTLNNVKVSKSDAFKALENILDRAVLNQYQHAEDIITITRFIEQQWESNERSEAVYLNGNKLFEVTAKSEGTI